MKEKDDIKILYIDDEDAWRVVFQRSIESMYGVIVARNAEEGWELLQKHSDEIGVIISDQRMPGRPGIELLKQARAYYPKIVRIITTGFSDSTLAVHATNQGAVYHYISKPWNSDELVSVIKRAMDFYRLRYERDNLLERKLSSIQRKNLESKLQCLLVFAVSNQVVLKRPIDSLGCYLKSIQYDPGIIGDVRNVFRQSQSELGSLLRNLDLTKRLIDLPEEIAALDPEISADPRSILLKLRDECNQVIYSVQNPQGLTLEDLTLEENFMADRLVELVNKWIGENSAEMLLQVSESSAPDDCKGEKVKFLIRISTYIDSGELKPSKEDPGFNGNNLPEAYEVTWLRFLISAYHFDLEVNPIFISKNRLVFEFNELGSSDREEVGSETVVADLIRKFEEWNYTLTRVQLPQNFEE